MATMYVTAEALNLRSKPTSDEDNRIGSLHLTQKVETLDEATPAGWVKVRATIGSQSVEGFVARRFLRAPLTTNREALIAAVHTEYMRFNRGFGKEHIAPFSGFVGEMWKAIGNDNLDGTDDVPWSAAAISFMVRKAGSAYANFKFAAAHSKFVHNAIRARRSNDASAPFWGFRLDEVRPQIGDIVVRDNPDFAPAVNFDVAANLDSYRSHSDIIVAIESDRQRVLTIGGNVSHSVGVSTYALAPGDFLSEAGHTFAILRNRTDG
jgi:hypothetical protein